MLSTCSEFVKLDAMLLTVGHIFFLSQRSVTCLKSGKYTIKFVKKLPNGAGVFQFLQIVGNFWRRWKYYYFYLPHTDQFPSVPLQAHNACCQLIKLSLVHIPFYSSSWRAIFFCQVKEVVRPRYFRLSMIPRRRNQTIHLLRFSKRAFVRVPWYNPRFSH